MAQPPKQPRLIHWIMASLLCGVTFLTLALSWGFAFRWERFDGDEPRQWVRLAMELPAIFFFLISASLAISLVYRKRKMRNASLVLIGVTALAILITFLCLRYL